MKKLVVFALLLAVGNASATAVDPIVEAFERLCGATEKADSLPAAELKNHIAGCDALLETLNTADRPDKKILIFRLKKCRELFDYLLELSKDAAIK